MERTTDLKDHPEKSSDHKFIHTDHSSRRATQRRIRDHWIDIVIMEGRVIHKQDRRFFFMTHQELKYHSPALQERLQGLVVILSNNSDALITCYRRRTGHVRHIRRKPKRLATA